MRDILYSEYRKQSDTMKKPMTRKKLGFIGFFIVPAKAFEKRLRPETADGLFFAAGIRLLFIGQSRKIIHTGVECRCDPLTLLERVVSFSVFDLGVITLIDPGEHLHLHLGQLFTFT